MAIGPFTSGSGSGVFSGPAETGELSEWVQLKAVSQGGGTPVDPQTMGTTGTGFNSTTGRATIVWGAHVLNTVGYQNGVLRWSIPLLTLYPDFDPDIDSIEIALKMSTWAHGTVETGIWGGILDSTTVDASLGGAAAAITQGGAAQDQIAIMSATALTPVENIGLCDEMRFMVSFGSNGSDYDCYITTDVSLEDGTKALGPTAQGTLLTSPMSNWQVTFGGCHRSTDSTANTVTAFDVFYRRFRRSTLDTPRVSAGAKKTSGSLIVVLIGDSIADGIGADPTGNGLDGLAFGGATPGAGITIYDDGVLRATYQDSAGAGPDPGYMPHIGQTALSNGFTSVTIYRWAVSGNTTATIKNNRFHEAATYMAANSLIPDLVVVVGGTNDAQTSENAAFEVSMDALIMDIEATWPTARLCWIEPVALAAGSYPEADLVRTDIQTRVAARSTRCRVSGTSVDGQTPGRADDAHPSLAGYRLQGRAIIPAYLDDAVS